ncbi:uncharacterized protein BDR25DRAFT_284851 [Lindgomyces ingoldianus]|uniref:Uncharacterized protein n=1 Tax=Lindgomyces ingoldianus TaxID=673940 RepID=A0ACB6QZD2_9PLEO|nr:uncharacterized protein BDR25DRAFT_284851 [Lindgomyces ingoldianus]KAF2472256.1 hypothetical protein BDR25DRAFT_284851 [Lindgomyces ingoldianus]
MSSYGYNNTPQIQQTNQMPTAADDRARSVEYLCGDCDSTVALKRGEPIRCRSCGHRVLYKQRTNRMVQFEAR